MTSKQRCLNAIAGRPVDRVPVFPLLMFFAVDRAKITYRQYASDAANALDAVGHAAAASVRVRPT